MHTYVIAMKNVAQFTVTHTHTQYNSDEVLLCKQVARIECKIGGARVEIVCKQTMGKIGTHLELTQSDWLQNDAFCRSMQGIYNK